MRWSSCVLCLVSSLAWAAPSGANDAATPLDLPHAVARGGERGPGVAVASAPRGSVLAAQDASHTFFTLPPRLSVQAGPRFYGAGAGIEVGATLMQDVPLRAIGTARSDVADALLSATDANVAKARLDAMVRGWRGPPSASPWRSSPSAVRCTTTRWSFFAWSVRVASRGP